MITLAAEEIRRAVQAALAEDIGEGDVTSESTIAPTSRSQAHLVSRQKMVVCGLAFAELAFREVSTEVEIQPKLKDGQAVDANEVLMVLTGPTRALLSAERVALNFLQRLSGVATLTSRYVQAVRHTHARILDTRKTTPGWRRFEKYAVGCGGGTNHRMGLFDMVLVKDNHLAALRGEAGDPVAEAVRRARLAHPHLKVEIEADTLEQVAQAADAGADWILLDNMSPEQLRAAVALVRKRSLTEASGGVNLQTVAAIAETGVDYISVGALTHSAPAADIALDFAG